MSTGVDSVLANLAIAATSNRFPSQCHNSCSEMTFGILFANSWQLKALAQGMLHASSLNQANVTWSFKLSRQFDAGTTNLDPYVMTQCEFGDSAAHFVPWFAGSMAFERELIYEGYATMLRAGMIQTLKDYVDAMVAAKNKNDFLVRLAFSTEYPVRANRTLEKAAEGANGNSRPDCTNVELRPGNPQKTSGTVAVSAHGGGCSTTASNLMIRRLLLAGKAVGLGPSAKVSPWPPVPARCFRGKPQRRKPL